MGKGVPELVGAGEVRAMLGVSKQRASQITRSKSFPDPVQTLIQGPIWLRSDVEEWIRKHRPHLNQDQADDED